MKSEVLLSILKDLVSEMENAEPVDLSEEDEEVQTLDDLFQELLEVARDEEEYELVSALEGVYSLWHTF